MKDRHLKMQSAAAHGCHHHGVQACKGDEPAITGHGKRLSCHEDRMPEAISSKQCSVMQHCGDAALGDAAFGDAACSGQRPPFASVPGCANQKPPKALRFASFSKPQPRALPPHPAPPAFPRFASRIFRRAAGSRERYGGTEYSMTDLVEKAALDIVVARWAILTRPMRQPFVASSGAQRCLCVCFACWIERGSKQDALAHRGAGYEGVWTQLQHAVSRWTLPILTRPRPPGDQVHTHASDHPASPLPPSLSRAACT